MKPILFNTEMVRAILDGRKTVTRRVVTPQPRTECDHGGQHEFIRDDFTEGSGFTGFVCKKCGYGVCGPHFKFPVGTSWLRPPYRPGDILYVRETWSPVFIHPKRYLYKADSEIGIGEGAGLPIKWRPSIHMPKEAARLFLRVKGVRVERLHDITEDGAKQEGIQYTDFGTYLPNWKMSIDGGKTFHSSKKEIHHPGYHVGQADTPEKCYQTAKGAFRALWNSTIKPADRAIYGWEANPWVWVIEFERITREEAENG